MKSYSFNFIASQYCKYGSMGLAKIVKAAITKLKASNLELTFYYSDDYSELSAVIREINERQMVGVWKEFNGLMENEEFIKMINFILDDLEIQRRYKLRAFL